MTDLTIGIVNFNGRRLLADCLASIDGAGIRYSREILVVDNGSTDGTATWLRRERPNVRVVENRLNRGVAAGNNQCFEHGRGRYVLLLNSDTIVLPGMVDQMIAFAESNVEVGAVGGRLLNPDGSFQASFADFPTLSSEAVYATRSWVLFDRRFPYGCATSAQEVDWIPSACLLVRRGAARQVGGVDEEYFMYSDETDLQYRLKMAGWRIYYLPDVSTIHLGGGSASHWQQRKLMYRGKLLFFRKHRGRLQTAGLRLVFAASSLAKSLVWSIAWPVPSRRSRARDELRSNLDVVRLACSGNLTV